MSESRRPIAGLREHEFASLVPEMRPEEYAALLADIDAHGVLQPLEVSKAGVVLDGRHRLRAARKLGHARLPVRVVAPDDEQEYMVRVAVSRRHLTPGQRATAVVGRRRSTASGRRRGRVNAPT